MSLIQLAAKTILFSSKYQDRSDPVLLDILSEVLDLPFKEDLHAYVEVGEVVTVETILRTSKVCDLYLAQTAASLGDSRMVEIAVRRGQFNPNDVKYYIRSSCLIPLLERYGAVFNCVDLSVIINIQEENEDWIALALN